MSKIETAKYLWKNNRRGVIVALYNYVIKSGVLNRMSDKSFLNLTYWVHYGRKINWENPQTFNEKLQWLKVYSRNPEFTRMVDKYEVKQYVADIIGDQYIIPTIGVWDNVDDIDFDSLPEQYVIKCTHDSGSICICKDKSTFNVKKAQKKLAKGLKNNMFYWGREWPYKNVKPRIIAEKYLEDESGWQLKDYKIFCFNGEPKFIEVDYDRYVGHKLNVYDLNWNFVDFYMTSPNDKDVNIPRPEKLDQMLDFARVLSKGIDFIRVDFYSVKSNIYFGELTLSPGCGMIEFHPKEYDKILGDMLLLSRQSNR